MARRKASWFGVRTLCRVIATGKPKSADATFDAEATLVEDRIVLFRALDFDDAVAQGEAEAKEYCKRTRYSNIYGQRVRLEFLKLTDAFQMEGRPGSGVEVYSAMEIVPMSVSDDRLVAKCFGTQEEEPREGRAKFVDGSILREVVQVTAR